MTSQQHHTLPVDVPPANRFTIMVIDDMLSNRVLLNKVLQTTGYGVIEASNGIEALEMLMSKGARPDLIVTDVEMPVMDGITMVEQIRQLENGIENVPIIIASGNPDAEMEMQSVEAGANLFMTKPFELKNLRRKIATLLKKRRNNSDRITTVSPLSAANRLDARMEKLI